MRRTSLYFFHLLSFQQPARKFAPLRRVDGLQAKPACAAVLCSDFLWKLSKHKIQVLGCLGSEETKSNWSFAESSLWDADWDQVDHRLGQSIARHEAALKSDHNRR